MKQARLIIALTSLPMAFAGCDIFKADVLEAPGVQLTGRVVYNGQPVPVRVPGGNQLQIWDSSWEKDDPERQPTSMDVHLQMDGSYSAMVYNGEYEIQLIDNSGPWVNDTTRIPIVVSGNTQKDVPVQPYYTIEDANIVFNPPAAGDTETAGSITATFRVGKHVATPQVELVGLYVNTTTFVDRSRRDNSLMVQTAPPPPPGQSANNPHERSRAQVQTELDNDQPITITLRLPKSILLTRSPDPRTTVYARVGVKTQGVTELAYSDVEAVSIAQ